MISTKQKYELYKPKKFLGQNFLVDDNIAKKIVASLGIAENDTVIEIGPGRGVLTKYIQELTDNFYAVELDRSIFEDLKIEYGGSINLIHKDFLKIDLDADISIDDRSKRFKVIGNIPYNITTEILFRLFESADRVDSAVLMMQKEVAKRLTAVPDTKDYGILAIQTQLHTVPKILFNVPPTAFFPKPNVFSSIVKLDFRRDLSGIKDRRLFKELVRESFGKRRKTMRNSLKKFFERNELDVEKINFDLSRRPENVTIREFELLSNDLFELILNKNSNPV
ncbi:MAG TPA: 16S rRNA (adenine(1518)-N(6)/adenine(1519)-N(6))-dimethyltransferase RsmA [Ignavibacteria bacterium]|nr:16S rRNA (adenine(1518)-N(6)/adenine(1519)-N(6))-dimethyltransferase RsmA [Ignavibacteria bacterium]